MTPEQDGPSRLRQPERPTPAALLQRLRVEQACLSRQASPRLRALLAYRIAVLDRVASPGAQTQP